MPFLRPPGAKPYLEIYIYGVSQESTNNKQNKPTQQAQHIRFFLPTQSRKGVNPFETAVPL